MSAETNRLASKEATSTCLETFGLRLISPCCHVPIPSIILDAYPKQYSDEGYGLYVCPRCGDIVDHLTDITTLNKPEKFTIKRPQPPIPSEKILQDVYDVFTKWVELDGDIEVIDIFLAASLDRHRKGDPFWLFVVGASGDLKTEMLRSNQSTYAYTLDSLTPKTLISGKTKPEYDEDTNKFTVKQVKGLLPQIDAKVLIIKDFTTILSMQRDDRAAVFSDLRTLYDGYIEKGFGTEDQKVSIPANIGLIAAVTPEVDKYTSLYVTLGERFLKIRKHSNPTKVAKKALENMGHEESMRKEIQETVTLFLEQFPHPLPNRQATPEQLAEIRAIAGAVAVLRTPVTMKVWRGNVDDLNVGTPEMPTRLSKQLLKAAYLLADVRGRQEDVIDQTEIETVRRLGRDTCYPHRIKILRLFMASPLEHCQRYTTREVAEKTGIPRNTAWRELKEMEYLQVVTSDSPREDNWKADWQDDGWHLNKQAAIGDFKKLLFVPLKSLRDNNSLSYICGTDILACQIEALLLASTISRRLTIKAEDST